MRTLSDSRTMKLLGSATLIAAAAGVAGLGTFGAFTSTTAVDQQVSSSDVTLSTATEASPLGVPVAGFIAGDAIHKSVTLVRSGEQFGTINLTTTAAASSVLTTDTALGLQMAVDQCSVAWVKAGPTGELTCSGTQTVALASRPAVSPLAPLASGVSAALNASAGAKAYLRVSLNLPLLATDAFENKTATVNFQFDATSRAGTIF